VIDMRIIIDKVQTETITITIENKDKSMLTDVSKDVLLALLDISEKDLKEGNKYWYGITDMAQAERDIMNHWRKRAGFI
jgi:hypothetical protein